MKWIYLKKYIHVWLCYTSKTALLSKLSRVFLKIDLLIFLLDVWNKLFLSRYESKIVKSPEIGQNSCLEHAIENYLELNYNN